MYRTCPSCKKPVYIDFIQAENQEDGKDLPINGEFAMRCPNCSKAITFCINLMTEKEYKEFEAKKDRELEVAMDDLYEKMKAFENQPKETTASIEYDKVENIDFMNSCICFTGKFDDSYITRNRLTLSCEFLGAVVNDKLTKDVNILVVGSKTSCGWIGGNYGRKIENALARRAESKDILILSEENFINILKLYEDRIKKS